MIRVAAYTGGVNTPSSRFRVRQYIPLLREQGIEMREFAPVFGRYPPMKKLLRPAWAVASVLERFGHVSCSYAYDVSLLQREMLTTLVTLEPMTKAPRVLDVDDAIWVLGGDQFARRLAALCDTVICGNEFLAEAFAGWSKRVAVLPTGVDTERYIPGGRGYGRERPIVGWSGTSSGHKYLLEIEEALRVILREYPEVMLRVVSDTRPLLAKVPPERVEFRRWSPETEVAALQDMTIGLMPLSNSIWERGKCSLKMLTYMACTIPVVVSPVGMNREVLGCAPCGFGAGITKEWIEAIGWLLENPGNAIEMGRTGRRVVEERYSTRVLASDFAKALTGAALGRG